MTSFCSKRSDDLGQSLLRGEGDQDLPVFESSLSSFELTSAVLCARGELWFPICSGESSNPVTSLAKAVLPHIGVCGGVSVSVALTGEIRIGDNGRLGVLGGVCIHRKVGGSPLLLYFSRTEPPARSAPNSATFGPKFTRTTEVYPRSEKRESVKNPNQTYKGSGRVPGRGGTRCIKS